MQLNPPLDSKGIHSFLTGLFDGDLHVKIDQSLDATVHAIIAFAHSLGISVTAEGVETQEQLDLLRDSGCGQVQGYLLSRPVPASDVLMLLTGTFANVHAHLPA